MSIREIQDPSEQHLGLDSEQIALRLRAREIAQSVIAPRTAEVDQTEQYPWDHVETLRDSGFMGMTIPKAYGGPGLSFVEAVLVIEEMARVCGVTGRIVVESNMGAISAVLNYGTEEQKKLAADFVLSGDKPAICITEPDAGSAATEMTTRADRKGDGYVINGSKHWITGGGVSRLQRTATLRALVDFWPCAMKRKDFVSVTASRRWGCVAYLRPGFILRICMCRRRVSFCRRPASSAVLLI